MTPRERVRQAVLAMVRESGGMIVHRPVLPGQPDWPEPEPLAGIKAARHIGWAAQQAVRRLAAQARSDGRSWAQIGEAMGFRRDPGHGVFPAVEGFRVAASDLGGGLSASWRCPQCGAVVLDYGPEAGGPADSERGHGEGCARLAADIAAWDASWDDADAGGGEND